MKNSKQIKIAAIISYIAIVVNIAVGLIYTPWMVNKIGKGQYAIYTLANSLISMFLVDFGLSSATARYVSNYNAEGRQGDVNNFLGLIYKLYAIVDAVIFGILFVYFFFLGSIYVKLTAEELQQFKIVYIMSASFSLFNLPFVTQSGVLTAYSKFIQLKLSDLIYHVLLTGLAVAVLLLGWGLYALVGAHIVAGVLNIIYKQIVIATCTPVKANFRFRDKGMFKSIFKFSFLTTLDAVASRLVFTISPSILGIVSNSSEIAVFGVVQTVEGYSYTITSAINGMFMPSVSKAYAESKEDAPKAIYPLFLGVGKFNFLLNGLIVVGLFLVGKPFITLWMGAEYQNAYLGILLVTLPGLFYNSLQVANTTLVVRNKVHVQAIITSICGVLNVGLSFLLSKFYGAVGACVSICIAYSVRAVIYHFVHQKVTKFDVLHFMLKCYLRCFPAIAITLGLGMVFVHFFSVSSWARFALAVVAITAVYVLSALFLCISKKERIAFFGKITGRFKPKRAAIEGPEPSNDLQDQESSALPVDQPVDDANPERNDGSAEKRGGGAK